MVKTIGGADPSRRLAKVRLGTRSIMTLFETFTVESALMNRLFVKLAVNWELGYLQVARARGAAVADESIQGQRATIQDDVTAPQGASRDRRSAEDNAVADRIVEQEVSRHPV